MGKLPGPKAQANQVEPLDDAFDLWLRRGLHRLHDDIQKERIPETLLRIIEDGCAVKKE